MGALISRRAVMAALSGQLVRTAPPRFVFELLEDRPVLDLSPHHVRMCACYRDRRGVYHLFADFIDAALGTIASWGAEIRYYRSPDLRRWEFVDTAAARGRWRGSTKLSDPDWYGAASPGVLVSYGKVYLFYSGREHGRGPGPSMMPWFLRSRILLATAPTDRAGAPVKPFVKQGVVVDKGPGEAWDSLRLDDPCPVRAGDMMYLYFEGLPAGGGLESRKVGVATSLVGKPQFVKRAAPIHAVEGGCEMPRVFRHRGGWHMFLRHFRREGGTLWRHYISADRIHWRLHNPVLFDGAGPEPGRGAADLAVVRAVDGRPAEPLTALATGMESGVLKLWAYRVRTGG